MTQDEMWLLDEKYHGEKTESFFADCARLKTGEPLAYIIGHVPFQNTTIHLDSHPLIPRPETEFWVERALTHIRTAYPHDTEVRILDLCAGSGCIGVGVLKNIDEARVDFAEIDARHRAVIVRNISENMIDADRARIFEGDLFENIGDVYDVILSNPPYIDPALDRTELSVTDFEPHGALYGGEHGLAIIERIIANAGAHLNERGVLYLEHEPEQTARIRAISTARDFIATTHTDQYGIERYTVLTRETL